MQDPYAMILLTMRFAITFQLAKGNEAMLNFNQIEDVLTNFQDMLTG